MRWCVPDFQGGGHPRIFANRKLFFISFTPLFYAFAGENGRKVTGGSPLLGCFFLRICHPNVVPWLVVVPLLVVGAADGRLRC